MSPIDFSAWLTLMGRGGRPLSEREAARRLGVCRNTVKGYRRGEARIPAHIALACSALAFGLPEWRRAA